MPRRYRSAAGKEAIPGGASSEAVPGRAKLDTLLEKVKAPSVSSADGSTRLTVNVINLYRTGLMHRTVGRTLTLAAMVVAGCSFGTAWVYAPTKKPPAKKE